VGHGPKQGPRGTMGPNREQKGSHGPMYPKGPRGPMQAHVAHRPPMRDHMGLRGPFARPRGPIEAHGPREHKELMLTIFFQQNAPLHIHPSSKQKSQWPTHSDSDESPTPRTAENIRAQKRDNLVLAFFLKKGQRCIAEILR
jgi:hypothetical protein